MSIALAIRNSLVIAATPKLSMLAGRLSFISGTIDSSSCSVHCYPSTTSGLKFRRRHHRTFYYPSSRLLHFSNPKLQTLYLAFYGAMPYFRVIATAACALCFAEMYGVLDPFKFLLMMDFVFLWSLLNTLRVADRLFFEEVMAPLLNMLVRDIPYKKEDDEKEEEKKEKEKEKKKFDSEKTDNYDDNKTEDTEDTEDDIHSETSTVVEDCPITATKGLIPFFDFTIVTLTILMAVLCYAGTTYLTLSYIQYHALCSVNVVLPSELVRLIVGNQICVLAVRCLFGKFAPWRSDRKETSTNECTCTPAVISDMVSKLLLKDLQPESVSVDTQPKSRSVSLDTLVESDSDSDFSEYISAEE
ncbi:uncharacterized protein SAPINGB_P004133 [Magnusiomyces paraingens]|uniref:Uncharacterized protein n=1 Tax=Magnusiomyces paraingens TaxID=2606893 RepID=A0A5E8BSX3_9ASCO|nr:uncharacterized protein SAPINGB_P004133 [Saprochaete ingens]VVT54553.1 unnamed protein product [Saprochaete ingens]